MKTAKFEIGEQVRGLTNSGRSIKGTITGFTKTGMVKVRTYMGIKCTAVHNLYKWF